MSCPTCALLDSGKCHFSGCCQVWAARTQASVTDLHLQRSLDKLGHEACSLPGLSIKGCETL